MQDQRIVLIGGSGFIGSHFMDVLDESSVTILDLYAPVGSPNARYMQCDIRDSRQLRAALDDEPYDVIINLAAEHKDFGITREQYFATNETGTENILSVASEIGVSRLVFFSSVAVYGDIDTPSSELSQPMPSNDYGASKLAAEKVIRRWASEDSDREVLIIRPTVVFGERNTANVYRLIQQISAGRYFNVGSGENIKSIAYVKNLVDATLHLMTHWQNGVDVFNYADTPHLTVAELAAEIAGALGRRKPRSLPAKLVETLALPFDLMVHISGRDLPISRARVRKLSRQTHHTAEKIRGTGFHPRYDTRDGLARMVRSLGQS